jgi:hypothetical protein
MEAYPKCYKIFQKAGWLSFLQKFQGYNEKVARPFAQAFYGRRVRIGELEMEITKDFIAQAIELPQEGEKWFKNQRIVIDEWKKFLVNHEKAVNWNKGIHVVEIKSKWRNIMFILQKHVTCEGRYGLVFYYHLRLLLHFVKGYEINMSFYLLSSLKKMVLTIYKSSRNVERSLYHYGLIKLLIVAKLQQLDDTWDDFLLRNRFLETEEEIGHEDEIEAIGNEDEAEIDMHMSDVET